MTERRHRWRGAVGEPWFPHDRIDEGGCPFTDRSPFTELYHHDGHQVPAAGGVS